MSAKLVLYIGEKNVSSWSMRAWVAMTHKGLAFEERTISLLADRDRRARRAIGSTGRVPVLHHGALVVPDSLAIIEYLEETFPPPRWPALWPPDTPSRARARSLAATMHAGFTELRASMSFNLCFLAQPPAPSATALGEARELLALLEDALATKSAPGPFLFGEFSAADAMFAPAVWRLVAFRVNTGDFPRAAAYVPALLDSPAVASWLAAARRLPPVERE